MPIVDFNDAAKTVINSSVQAATTRAGKYDAYANAFLGLVMAPTLVVKGSGTAVANITLTNGFTRVGDRLRLPSQTGSCLANSPISPASVTSFELRYGSVVVTIDKSRLTLGATIPPGASTVLLNQSDIIMPPFPLGIGENSAPPSGPPPATQNGVPTAILNMASAPKTYTWTTSSSWTSGGNFIKSGDIIVESNAWNFGTYGLSTTDPSIQRIGIGPAVEDGEAASFKIEINIPYAPPQDPENRSYPSAIMGQGGGWGDQYSGNPWRNLPKKVSDVTSCWAGSKARTYTNVNNFHGHAVLDCRTTRTGQKTYGNRAPFPLDETSLEVMVVLDQFGGYGVHPDGKPADKYRGKVAVSGVNYHCYLQQGAETTLFVLIRESMPAPLHVDLGAIIRHFRTFRYQDFPNGAGSNIAPGSSASSPVINPNHFWISANPGIETMYGQIHAEWDTAYHRMNLDG